MSIPENKRGERNRGGAAEDPLGQAGPVTRQPHERAQAAPTVPREVIEQARNDLESGQENTDCYVADRPEASHCNVPANRSRRTETSGEPT
jgi:hypothetical protein